MSIDDVKQPTDGYRTVVMRPECEPEGDEKEFVIIAMVKGRTFDEAVTKAEEAGFRVV